MNYRRIPPRTKVRAKRIRGWFYVLARNGKGWVILDRGKTRDEALKFIEEYHTNKDIEWTTNVKIRAGWVCEECGEGLGGDKELLESHHIEPVHISPAKRHDLDNGQCLCIFHHAGKHTGHERLMILARLGLILYRRLYPQKKAEIKRMAG